MKVGFVTADWSDIVNPEDNAPSMGGSGWYRCGLPAKFLPTQGIETVCGELISVSSDGVWVHDWYGNTHDDCDVLVFQRWMHESASDVIRTARAAGQVVVQDLDDWYWGLHPSNYAFKATDPKSNPRCNRDHYWQSLFECDLLTTSTPFLKQKLETIGVPTVMLRNCIEMEAWERFYGARMGKLHVGWVGSTSHRSKDLETLQGVVGPFCDRHDARFAHCGWLDITPHAGQLAGVPQNRWWAHGMLPIYEYPQMFRYLDIGLVPLNKVDFNTAKSFIKGLEYAAAGVPFIAQDTDEYKVLESSGVGVTVRKPREWVRELERLSEVSERQMEADKNYENVKAFDISLHIGRWAEAYTAVR